MKPPHILIVDDEGDFRETLNLLLSMEGFQVSEASSGDHAIVLVDAGLRPDVLLLDYRMPGLNGGQTLEHMRSRSLDAPAVLLTAASEAHHLARHSYIAVSDVDECARRASSLGGKVIVPPHNVAEFGRVCAISDPTGAVAHLVQPKPGSV